MLPPARLIEAIECYQMLDEVAGQPVLLASCGKSLTEKSKLYRDTTPE